MKITKEQGRACLQAVRASTLFGFSCANSLAWDAIDEMACGEQDWVDWSLDEHLTALCLCAAIAGVKP